MIAAPSEPLSGLGRERALELASAGVAAARAAGATEAEVVLMTEDSGLTRYAANCIHQNVVERNAEVRIRVAHDRHVAVAGGNQLTHEAIAHVARKAAEMARSSPPDPFYAGLPHPSEHPYTDQTTYYESTADVDPGRRASTVEGIVALLGGAGAGAYGVITNGVAELTLANSHGLHCYQAFTDSWVSVIAHRGDNAPGRSPAPALWATPPAEADQASSGYATSCHRDWTEVDPESAALHALAKASLEPRRPLPAGRYTVVLEEEAVAEILLFLAWGALNGLNWLEGRSLYSGHLGQKLYPDWITLADDPTDPRGANVSFDFEGVPKRPVTFIRAGVVEEVGWDTATATRAARTNTAHALPAPNTYGPMPLNLVLSPGNRSRHDLIAGVERGILISRFHYVNDIDEARTLLTGMTRDGTFLIEHGEVVAPVGDLRWVESIDSVLRRTVEVGDSLKLISQGPGYGLRFLTGSLVPPILVEGFEITGSKED